MHAGRSPQDYKKENLDNRETCSLCKGTGYVPKAKVELSPLYPRMVEHPDQENHPGRRFTINTPEDHLALNPADHAALHAPPEPIESLTEVEAE